MTGLANQLYDGDMQTLADNVNRFFQGVAADLSPLDNSILPPSSDMNSLSAKRLLSES